MPSIVPCKVLAMETSDVPFVNSYLVVQEKTRPVRDFPSL